MTSLQLSSSCLCAYCRCLAFASAYAIEIVLPKRQLRLLKSKKVKNHIRESEMFSSDFLSVRFDF